MAKVKVTQTKSGVGGKPNHRETLRTLGLKKIGQSKVHEDGPGVRGMVRAVAHLVTIEEVD